ncbi:emerin homolog 1-like [Saccostrea cucullata]|uniref:emerin homolog 1-like n=1 Tax=Saccostrea cuccullata TaxID=36930 RepID=UPI002ED3DA64
MEDIQSLTDKELVDELRMLGANPGPIISSTRSVYEKRLLKLRTGGSLNTKPSSKKHYSEVPDDEDQSPAPKPRSPRLRKRVVPKPEPEEADEMDDSGAPDFGDEEPDEKSTGESGSAPQPAGGVATYAKILIFIIVLFFVYLVYINMEPSSGNRVPKIKG